MCAAHLPSHPSESKRRPSTCYCSLLGIVNRELSTRMRTSVHRFHRFGFIHHPSAVRLFEFPHSPVTHCPVSSQPSCYCCCGRIPKYQQAAGTSRVRVLVDAGATSCGSLSCASVRRGCPPQVVTARCSVVGFVRSS